MYRLKKVSEIAPVHASDIEKSRIGIGFEKLDRNVFDPKKAYDPVAAIGVKWVRIQSGWQRTEKEKGVYDFAWLDEIVDNLIVRGLKPWMCLCYGNELYDEYAAEVYGAVGCPPVHNEEQKTAWSNYVSATVEHFKGRVGDYEIWNEPDGVWCWKHGVNATELGAFNIATAKAVKKADPEAKVIGGAICMEPVGFINEAMKTGMGDWVDAISFHAYVVDETLMLSRIAALRAVLDQYNPNIEIIQGEGGSQSEYGLYGALKMRATTPKTQCKIMARHLVTDLLMGCKFTNYFTALDMIEALNGKKREKNSYLDYGHFGVMRADFDEDGNSVGTYAPKPSYYVLQNIASMFSGNVKNANLPAVFLPQMYEPMFRMDERAFDLLYGSFEKDGCYAFAYWKPCEVLTTDFQATVTLQIVCDCDTVYLADLIDGSIYELPEDMMEKDAFGCIQFNHLPVKDTPMLLLFGKGGKTFVNIK